LPFKGQVEVPALRAWALGATAEITTRVDKAAKRMRFIVAILWIGFGWSD